MADNVKYIDVNLLDGSVYAMPDLGLDLQSFAYEIGDTVAFIEKTEGRDAALKQWSEVLIPHYGVFLINLLGDAKGWSNQVKTLLEKLVSYAQASEQSIAKSATEVSRYLSDVATYRQAISNYKNTIIDLEITIEAHRKSVEENRKHSDETYNKTVKYDSDISDYIAIIDIYQNTILKYTQEAVKLEKVIRQHKEDTDQNKQDVSDILIDIKAQSEANQENIKKISDYENLINNYKNQIYALEITIKEHKNQVETDKAESQSILNDTEKLYYKTAAMKASADKSMELSQQAAAIATSHTKAISPQALKLLEDANDSAFENHMGFEFL